MIDFTSDAPTVISGAHNFSNAASEANDENYLIISGDTDVADSYRYKMLRLYDHYRVRYVTKAHRENGETVKPPLLAPDDSWSNRYFKEGSLRVVNRLRFGVKVQ